ncbi:RagB/SusD family nutrient uptake outer membrane protein [Costertonia aggregata]|uniref:RagB/SusD family nutrient uptake outer membrane protein n=1 Tax=Costertonia aggregata TaxID=343403 RepID=A0A7H9AQM0_9FLAO|nr:RagB/SusD family nutrient uptake outer membrane protein [Costertonia aggregata]QLG45740.1 RagB/SusD family nutrient uptake outer membrane protein [Costertonia aggregata]
MINKRKSKSFLSMAAAALLVAACTDLEIEGTDSIIDESTASGGIFNGVDNVESALDNVYGGFNRIGDQTKVYALNEVTTDELLVPTRGTDWGDNGIWRTLHQHTWDAAHPYVLDTWNDWNSSVFLASEIIDERSGASASELADAKFLRAYAMWTIMDLYGQVPFRAPDEGPSINPRVLTRTEALDFVIQDLRDAIPNLPERGPDQIADNKRASQAAGNFLLAKVLLNAHVYRGTTPDNSDMAEVISLVDEIAADGYALQDGYFDIFKEDADSETIWWIPTGVGNRIWNGMHYNINSPDNGGGGWNGFSTLAEFYDLFEGDPNSNYIGDGQEERRGWVPDATNADPETNYGIGYGFLIGQQYDGDGTPLKDRPGNPLVFTKEFPGLVGNNEVTGIRTIKYHPADGGSFRSHQIIFRYSDAHLMKAEAQLRSGGDATALVNELRVLRDAAPLGSVSEQDLLDERGRELYKEMTRRNDMIRFGQFTRDWEFKNPEAVGDDSKNLFPIPANALLSNPNLVQNPGY